MTASSLSLYLSLSLSLSLSLYNNCIKLKIINTVTLMLQPNSSCKCGDASTCSTSKCPCFKAKRPCTKVCVLLMKYFKFVLSS